MPDSVVPLTNEQAKALQEAIAALRDVGSFLRSALGLVLVPGADQPLGILKHLTVGWAPGGRL